MRKTSDTMLILAILSICVLSSCKKYLDKEPDNRYAYPTTIENILGLLDNTPIMNEHTPSFPESSTDDYFITEATFNSWNDQDKQVYLWQYSQSPPAHNDWFENYSSVYYANVGIEQIEKIPISGTNLLAWNNVKGSSYFFRAYYFLNLAWTYAKAYDPSTAATDLGIVLRKTTDVNVPSVRSSLKESYEQVIADAKTAAQFLPVIPLHPLRPSKPAAYGLLARTYLSMRMYDSAFKYADLSLQFKSELMNFNGDADIISLFSLSTPPFRKFNKETIFYTQTNLITTNYLPENSNIDSSLYASFSNDDLRKQAYFKPEGSYQKFKGSYSQGVLMFSGLATDEMYLIRAECFARLSNKDAALADLNYLLSTRWKTGTFVPFTAATSQDALEIILKERRKELLLRNLRWIDIKRLNKEGRNIILKRSVNNQVYSFLPNNDRYALPIPRDIIELTGMPQNPGW